MLSYSVIENAVRDIQLCTEILVAAQTRLRELSEDDATRYTQIEELTGDLATVADTVESIVDGDLSKEMSAIEASH